jgi:hypothetical protein
MWALINDAANYVNDAHCCICLFFSNLSSFFFIEEVCDSALLLQFTVDQECQ